MKTPRHRRIGLIATAASLALVGAVLSPAQAAAPSSLSSITVDKTWIAPLEVNTGATVVAEIDVHNPTVGAITDVVVNDVYDPGLAFVSAAATGGGVCANDPTTGFRNVTCTFASVGAGATETITLTFTAHYWGYRTYTRNYRTGERLEIQKAETHVDILSGQEKTYTVECPANFDILDASWHLQQLDQDTGDFYDVYRIWSSTTADSASVRLFNDSAGKAQGKLWALCLKDETNQGNPVGWHTPAPETSVVNNLAPSGPHERPFYAECPQHFTPMMVNISAVPGVNADPDATYMDEVLVQTGLEADGGRRATIWATVRDYANVTLSWRCLETRIGPNRLVFDNVTDGPTAVPLHDKVAQSQINCDHHHKGVIGGWRGGAFNGSEPRPKTRIYWLWHDGATADPGPGVSFTGNLLCLHNRLFRGGKVKKNGTIKDPLHNHARGTSGLDPAWSYITPHEPVAPMVVRQTS